LNQTKIMTRKCYEEIIWLREWYKEKEILE
jgi:hypothetical protein